MKTTLRFTKPKDGLDRHLQLHEWPPKCKLPDFQWTFDEWRDYCYFQEKRPLQPGVEWDKNHPFDDQHDPPVHTDDELYPPLLQPYDMYSENNSERWVLIDHAARTAQIKHWWKVYDLYRKRSTEPSELARPDHKHPIAGGLCDAFPPQPDQTEMDGKKPPPSKEVQAQIDAQRKICCEANWYLWELGLAVNRIINDYPVDQEAFKACLKEIHQAGADLKEEEKQLSLLEHGQDRDSAPVFAKEKHWKIPPHLQSHPPVSIFHDMDKWLNWEWTPPPDNSWWATMNAKVEKMKAGFNVVQAAFASDKCVQLFGGSRRKKTSVSRSAADTANSAPATSSEPAATQVDSTPHGSQSTGPSLQVPSGGTPAASQAPLRTPLIGVPPRPRRKAHALDQTCPMSNPTQRKDTCLQGSLFRTEGIGLQKIAEGADNEAEEGRRKLNNKNGLVRSQRYSTGLNNLGSHEEQQGEVYEDEDEVDGDSIEVNWDGEDSDDQWENDDDQESYNDGAEEHTSEEEGDVIRYDDGETVPADMVRGTILQKPASPNRRKVRFVVNL